MTQHRQDISPGVVAICERLEASGKRGWIVGGCVRDLLMGRQVSDWDVATTALPDDVRRIFRKVIPTGIKHGTVTVILDGDSYEVTTLRGEGAYTDGRRPDTVVYVRDIVDDLARRDFTMNAIALEPLTGEIIDPFGGRGDIERKLIRAVGDPLDRFGEDGLRSLRACRFVATLEFDIDAPTARAIPLTIETFRKVSAERVRDEWLKALQAPRASRAFRAMLGADLLQAICPELASAAGCAQNRFHAYDVLDHTMAALDACPPGDPILRLAVLLHDIGKPRSRAFSEEKQDYTFYNHEQIGAELADAFMKRLRLSNAERERVVHLVRHHLVFYDEGWSDAAVRRFVRKIGPGAQGDLFVVMRADAAGRGRADKTAEDLQRIADLQARVAAVASAQTALRTTDLHVDGRDVMETLDIPPSRRVGEILQALLERVLDDPSLNERQRLLALLPEVAGRCEP